MDDQAASPLDVLVVASWFPTYEDLAVGRFVADQVEALAATGAARPRIVTFERAQLTGGGPSRRRQESAVLASSARRIATADPLFVEPAWGVRDDIPVARLSIPEGQTPATRTAHAAAHRESAVGALADRLLAGGGTAADGAGGGVVHAQGGYPDGAAGAVLASRLDWPLLITEHSTFVARILADPAQRTRYAAALARSHRLIAVGEMLAGELRATFPDHARRIVVVPNAVPMDDFEAAPLKGRVVDQLLFVGYRKPVKGIDVLLRAVAFARRARPSITLRLLGGATNPAVEDRWRALAKALDLSDAVTFEGTTDRRGIAAAMARASVFVHASRRETFGVVAVEALASGLPVVATDSGGVTETMGDDPDALGALVPADDPDALAAAIVATLERRADFDPEALRGAVERRFGSAFVAEKLLVLYREAIAAAAPGRSIEITSGRPSRPVGRPVIVALDRARAARALEPLPPDLRSEVWLLTSAQPAGAALASIGRIVEVELDPACGRRRSRPHRRGAAVSPAASPALPTIRSGPSGADSGSTPGRGGRSRRRRRRWVSSSPRSTATRRSSHSTATITWPPRRCSVAGAQSRPRSAWAYSRIRGWPRGTSLLADQGSASRPSRFRISSAIRSPRIPQSYSRSASDRAAAPIRRASASSDSRRAIGFAIDAGVSSAVTSPAPLGSTIATVSRRGVTTSGRPAARESKSFTGRMTFMYSTSGCGIASTVALASVGPSWS